MAELHGHVGGHQAGHEAGKEDDGAYRNHRQHEAQPHAPASHGNQQGGDGDFHQRDDRTGGGDGQLLAPEAEEHEQGPEEVAQPFHNGGEGIQDNAEGGEEGGAGSHGAQHADGLLHDVGDALAQMGLGLGLIHALPQSAAQEILLNGLLRIGLHALVVVVRHPAQRRNPNAHQRHQQGHQKRDPEVQVPVALAPEAGVGQAADVGQGQQEAHGYGGHTGSNDHGLPLGHTALLVLVVDGDVAHGEVTQEGGNHYHGSPARELEHGAHDGADQHTHEFHQTVVHQQRQEQRRRRNADADGDQDVVHDEGSDALAAQGIHTVEEPAHPGGMNTKVDVHNQEGKEDEADDLEDGEGGGNLGGMPELIGPKNEQVHDAVHADGPDHEGHGLEIAGVQGSLQEVGEVGHQHIGLGGHLSPLPSADGELVLGQAEIDKKREYAKHREQHEANPCLDRVIRKGFHQAVHPFLWGACLLNHKD